MNYYLERERERGEREGEKREMSESAAAVVVRKEVVVEERYCYDGDTELTIHKTSVFSKGDGFIVYDSVGQIMFRVDSFGLVKHHLLLMDPTGEPLLTLLPKVLN